MAAVFVRIIARGFGKRLGFVAELLRDANKAGNLSHVNTIQRTKKV